MGRILPHGTQILPHFCGLLASRTLRQYIAVVVSHTVCGTLYSSLRKLIENMAVSFIYSLLLCNIK